MRKKRVYICLGALMLWFIFAGGCSPGFPAPGERGTGPGPGGQGKVYLQVTRDHGRETLFEEEVALAPGQPVMSLLQEHLEVETEYGGGFVSSLGGLASGYLPESRGGGRADWFYKVNGVMSGLGAAQYQPRPGDMIWWDYHSWEEGLFTPAVVGSFPQPFLNGYRGEHPGVLVLAGKGCSELAGSVAGYLEEAGAGGAVEVRPYAEGLASGRRKVTLVVALWEELAGSRFWRGMQENRGKTGWFAGLEVGVFHALDPRGIKQESYPGEAGAILASGSGLGDPYPLWLVTATSPESLRETAAVLWEKPGELAKKYGVLVAGGEVIGLPVYPPEPGAGH